MRRRLVVIAGPPLGGAPPTIASEDEERLPLLSEACYRDTLCMCEDLDMGPADPPAQLIVVYPDNPGWYAGRTSNFWLQIPRMGAGMAQALDNTLIVLGPDRDDQSVFISIYTPHLSHKMLQQAFISLRERDTVLGPTTQGGVYLLGVRGKWPTGILGKVRWETDDADADLRKAFRRARVSVALLQDQYDVHQPAGMTRLISEMGLHPEPELSYLRRAFEDLDLTHPR